jgi:predicted unusual protein kinase regulating ubiquinone biosynthesis (AarF/ABC1/UbiB family)
MRTNLSELLASFPDDEKTEDILESQEAQERLQAIFADLAYRPVPVHSLQRMWTMGELSAQIALAYTGLWVRGLFADKEKRQLQAAETNLRVALNMIHRLGYLRGAATKLGQAFGSLPELLPEQVVATLDRLHAQAPPMHFSLLREVVRSELGKDPAELFAEFDKEPFAAASIGQVHRATLKSGEDVAVKIQYPGIGRAMQADMRNLMALVFPMRLTRSGESVRAQCEAMREMLAQETDYVREAENTREARELFTPADGIVVPRVFAEYSSSRVLTTEFIPGRRLHEFLASNPSQELRDAFGTKLSLAWFRMRYAANAGYSDPHSGNYIFMDDGRLGVLDFGCIQRLAPDELRIAEYADAYCDRRMTLEELLHACGDAAADIASADYMEPLRRHHAWLTEPVFHDGPFDFGDTGFFKAGIESLKEVVEKRYEAPAMYLYSFRAIFGLRVLSWRLKCRVDIGALWRQERKTGG